MLYRRSYVVLVVAFLGACGKHDTPTAVSSPTPPPVVAATPTPMPTPSFPGASSCARLPVQTKDIGNCPVEGCLLYTSPSPRDGLLSRMPSSA